MSEQTENSQQPEGEKKEGFFKKLFGKIKQMLGIGGVKIVIDADANITTQDTQISGKLTLTTKSDQFVEKVIYKVEESWQYKRNGETKYKTITLGEREEKLDLDLKAGEEKTIDFTVPFFFAKTNEDHLKDQGGVLGALGTASAFLKGHKSDYTLRASVNVKGTVLAPSTSLRLLVTHTK